MLAYAANASRHTERRSSPNAMLAIIAAHVALLAMVMSARIALPQRILNKPIAVQWINPIEPPPPNPHIRTVPHPQFDPAIRDPFVPVQPQPAPDLSTDPPASDPGLAVGPTVNPQSTPML